MTRRFSWRGVMMGGFVVVACLSMLLVSVTADGEGKGSNRTFSLSLDDGENRIDLNGESEFETTPSSISIYMNEEGSGRCAIHLLNFKTRPQRGSFHVGIDDQVRTAALCVLEDEERRERLASESGTFTITEITDQLIMGHVDMILVGGLTGKRYEFSGSVESISMSSNVGK